MPRRAITDFQLGNPLYKGASVTFYTVAAGVKTATKATLYAGSSGADVITNPQKLDGHGKFRQPVYIDVSVIGTVEGLTVPTHDTAIISPAPTFRIAADGEVQYSFDGGVSWESTGDYFFRNRGDWAPATAYERNDVAVSGGASYVSLLDHVSTADFATDLAAGKWKLLFTVGVGSITYAQIQNVSATDRVLGRSSPGAGVIEEIVCTAAARALLDDANAAAQRATLDVPSNAEALLDTIIDAKGDLIVGTAADTPARKAIGTDGTVLTADSSQSDGLAWTVPPARKNAIINGDFNVWQRGTSFTSIIDGAYSADRWKYHKTGAMVHDVSRSTDVPTVAQAGRLFNYSLLVDCTTVDAAIAAGDLAILMQIVEGFNFLPLAQRAFTLSFWVKATKTGIYCMAFRNGGADRSYVAEYTINAADTWEKKTITVPASPSAGTWDYTTTAGVLMSFALAIGSTYHTTAGAWQTGNFYSTANQVNACDSTSNNFRIAGVQLEPGSAASDFEQRTIQNELEMCKRYYQVLGGRATAPIFGGYASGASTYYHWFRFETEMRVTPTVAVVGTWAVSNCGQPTILSDDTKLARVQVVAAGAGDYVTDPNGTDDIFTISAEL